MYSKMKLLKRSSCLLRKFKTYSAVVKVKQCSFSLQKTFALPKAHTFFLLTFRHQSIPNATFVNHNYSISGKIFQETENEYAHKVMENIKAYSRSVLEFPLKVDPNFVTDKSHELLNIFDKFAKITVDNTSVGLSLENTEFSNLVENISSLLPQASDFEVKRTLHYLCMWPPTPKTFTPNFKILWNALDKECVKRLENWDISHKLLIADYWFNLRLSRISQYNRELIYNLCEHCESLSSHQVVQLMFYINLQRRFPNPFLLSLEKKLQSVIDSITIEELGIICLAYFKTESKISDSNLIQFIVKKLYENLDAVNTITVAGILKCLRKSYHISNIDTYISLMHRCIPYIKHWDIPTSVHLALLSSECNIYHPVLLNNVSDKLAEQISLARIKDSTKLLQCLAHFNHYEGKFHDVLLVEINKSERQKEISLYPRDIVYIALFHAYMGHFDYELLAKIFQKQFIEWCCSRFPDMQAIFAELDCCISIECQDYSGPKLNTSFRKVLENRRGNVPSKSLHQNTQTRILANVHESLVDILNNNDNVLIRHILPHVYTPDIIVRLFYENDTNFAEICHNTPSNAILIPPKNEIWASFVVCGLFSFANRSKQITGVTAMKLRQLKILGYHVIFVPFYDLPQNPSVRKIFLREKLKIIEENLPKKCTN